MERNIKRVFVIFVSLVCSFVFICFPCYSNPIIARADDNILPVVAYKTDKDYDYSNCNPVETMAFGKRSLGSLSISGDINEKTTVTDSNRKEYPAFGINTGQLSLSYNYDGSLLDKEGSYYLEEDTSKKFNGLDVKAKINKGILLIEKSRTGIEWEPAVSNPLVNFFDNNQTGKEDFYSTKGIDVNKGMFYRVSVGYKVKHNVDWKIDKASYYVEVYEFYACTNSGTISLHDLKADVSSMEYEGYSVDVLSRGETLLDEATTINGFSIDTFGSDYSITVNGNRASNGDKFTEDGKYTIKVKTKLGKETSKTVYVFKGGNDKGLSTYFDKYLVSRKKIFREGYKVPVYSRDSIVTIKEVDDSVPILTGTIRNNDNGEIITLENNRKAKEFVLSPGNYTAVLFSGNTASGSVHQYTYNFIVLDEDATPYFNKHRLDMQERLCDFKLQHYEVKYVTGRGGYIHVCFDSYDEAFKYAFQIEKRFLEYKPDGIYYKAEDGEKKRYPTKTTKDKLRLTEELNNNARKNIEIAFFDPSSEFSYHTLDESKLFNEALEDKSLAESVRVFPDTEEKIKMRSDDIPFLNGFTYLKRGAYDVKKVTAKCEATGETQKLFWRSIDTQLKVSSIYTITETNEYGDANTYEAIYLADNQTRAKLSINNSSEQRIISVDSHADITADSICFDEITNPYDSMAIAKIESEAYDIVNALTCPIESLKGLTLYKAGEYKVTFVDRVGNIIEQNITISGKLSYNDVKKPMSKTYSEIYNELHLNHSIKED